MTNSKTRVLVESPKLCLGYVGAGLNLDKWPVGKIVCWLACGDLGWSSVIPQKKPLYPMNSSIGYEGAYPFDNDLFSLSFSKDRFHYYPGNYSLVTAKTN